MSKKLHNIKNVVVTAHVASSNPILPIITVRRVIQEGSGSLTETIFGGQVTIHVELEHGQLTQGSTLTDGEFVYINGEKDGAPFTLSAPLTTDHATKPWKFTSVSGSTG